MKIKTKLTALSLITLINLTFFNNALCDTPNGSSINWQGWSEDIFSKSTADNKLVILNLEAVWCHWCHVMEEKTYSDAEVIELLNTKLISVKVDQDSRPDLSNRYKEYGWPATIIFDSKGNELSKRAGYIEPAEMKELLKKLIANPVPEKEYKQNDSSFSESAFLSTELRKNLEENHYNSFDYKLGSLRLAQKYLEIDSTEFSLINSANQKDRDMLTLTLEQSLKIHDPVWGGVYQYSTHHNWDHPHYEKIMRTQSNNLRIYALAANYLNNPKYIEVSKNILSYLQNFLQDKVTGAFYTSQDADLVKGEHSSDFFALSDNERRKAGIPTIDKHIYSRENGWAITAITALYEATLDESILDTAKKAAAWITENRKKDNGFSHDKIDEAGPFLGDNLAMGQAFLALHRVTGDRAWLEKAESNLKFIEQNFKANAGYYTSISGKALEPARLIDENINLARFANMSYHYTGEKSYKAMAEHSMKYLATESIALSTLTEAGILIADNELAKDPLHLCIVGSKNDPTAKELFNTALKYPNVYKRLEWWDKSEGPMRNPDVQYPSLAKSAAFICTGKRCSLPIFKAEDIVKTIERIK